MGFLEFYLNYCCVVQPTIGTRGSLSKPSGQVKVFCQLLNPLESVKEMTLTYLTEKRAGSEKLAYGWIGFLRSGRRLILQAVKPGQILLNQVGDGQVVGTAGQAFSTFRAMSGFLYQIRHPFRLLNISTESLDDALKSDSKLNFNFFRAGLTVVAASTELAVEFLLDGFDLLSVFLRERVAFLKDLPVLAGLFQCL